jgi:uncharacterized membrane protein
MKAFMWLPVVILGALLLFGQDISDWVQLKRLQYESYEKAASFNPDNFVVIDGVVYDKKGRKQ